MGAVGLAEAAAAEKVEQVGASGRYELVRMLGRGAMGIVFLARDTLLGREVALKTFSFAKTAESEVFRERLLREARTAGRLSHPNIVTVHDVFEENGAPYIAMEYVDGIDLLTLIQKQPRVEPQLAANICAKIAEALDYAHHRGVIHRDIKPANIILRATNHPKITDFGIACMHHSTLTTVEHFLGTPNYMAPEQIEVKPSDHRADLFSLGVVLFEMLTGERPFPGQNLLVVARQIVEEPAPLATSLVEDLPPQLALVIDKMLQKAPENRYARGADVSRDLLLAAGGADANELIASQDGDSTISIALRRKGQMSRLRGVLAQLAWRCLRLALLLGVTGAVVLGGLGYWFRVSYQSLAEPSPSDPRLERLRETVPHLQDAARLYRVGRYGDAVVAYERALALSPERQRIRDLRDRAERQAREVLAEEEAETAEEMAGARQEAAQAQADARKVKAAAAVVPLDVAFTSEMPSGVLTVHDAGRELLLRTFEFQPSGPSLLRRLAGRHRAGSLTASRMVTSGELDLRITWANARGETAERRLKAVVRRGDQPLLQITLSRKRQLEATLVYN